MSCLPFSLLMLTPLKLASARYRAFMPKRNSKTLPKLTSPDKLCLTFYTAVFLTLWQGEQIPSECSWETSLSSRRGAASGKFEQVEQIHTISYPGCALAGWSDSCESRMANSCGIRNRPTAFLPGWMKALWCIHRCLGWTNFQPGFYYLFANLDMHLPVQWIVLVHWWAGVSEALVLASWDDLVYPVMSCPFIWGVHIILIMTYFFLI